MQRQVWRRQGWTAVLALLCGLQGAHAQDVRPQGTPPQGTPPQSTPPQGTAPQGTAPLAVLHLVVPIDGGTIKVSDLWANAGAERDAVVGPAPPPGRSFAIEAGQLAYIARLFEVSWRPVSGVERTTVERAGRALTREEVEAPVRRSLVEAGAPPDAAVEFANLLPIEVPPLSFPQLAVEAISYDAGSQRFSANLAVSTEGMQTQRVRVSGRAVQMQAAVVAVRRLQPGEVIAEADLRLAQLPARRLAGAPVGDVAQAVGQSPKHAIAAGQPLAAGDIGPPLLVSKGETVVVMLDSPGMSLAVQGVALGQGGRDDVIQVMNPLSRAVVAARVAGPGRATILPGSVPLVAPASATPHNAEVAN